jgi:glycosyltransferase involved in cell wall biosynthesis
MPPHTAVKPVTAPKVSIGLPVYNGQRWLDTALSDLRAQTCRDIEIVVSDNASCDGTSGICARHAEGDPRVRVIRQQRNVGIVENFRAVVQEARGDFFMWAAYDDRWDPRFVEKAVAALEAQPGAVVAMSQIRQISETDEYRRTIRIPPGQGWLSRAVGLACGTADHNAFYGVYPRPFVQGAFAAMRWGTAAADRVFMLCVALAGTFAIIDEPLFSKRVSDIQLGKRYEGEQYGQIWRARLALVKTWKGLPSEIRRASFVPPARRHLWPLFFALFSVTVARSYLSGFWRNLRRPTRSGKPS